MAYPSIITTFTNPTANQKLNSPSHSTIETAQNTDLTAIETFVGTESSLVGTLMYDIRSTNSNGGGHVQTANKGGTGQTTFAKGDILVASSTSVLGKVSVGADNTALLADSTQTSGVKWGGVATATTIQNQTYTYARASVMSSSVYGVNLGQAVSVLSDGQGFVVKFPTTNTTSVLALSVNALGPSSVAARIKNTDGTNPIVGAIKASMIGVVEFDSVSSVFQLQNTYVPTYGTDTTQFLRNDGQFASVLTGVPTMTFGQATRAVASGTGTQTIAHGLGKTPTYVRIHATGFGTVGSGVSMGASEGTGTASNNTCTWHCVSATTNPFAGQTSTILVIMSSDGSTKLAEANISALDSTNITLNFTTMSGTGLNVWWQWQAFG